MKTLLTSLLLAACLFHLAPVASQFQPRDPGVQPAATAVRFAQNITLDGQLNEADWLRSSPATDFWETFPADTSRVKDQTEVYFGYDDKNLYVGAKCYVQGFDFVIPSLRRDYRAGGNDNLTLVFNPFKDKTNAIVFGMNPLGVTREALIYNGGESSADFREEWDNKWYGESFIGENYWSVEMVIPFISLRFPEGDPQWYFNSYRFDTQSNTRSTWNRIPQNQVIMSLAYMGTIDFLDGAPQAQSGNTTLIPYISGGVTKDYDASTAPAWNSGVGGDAKVGIGSGLNLDLTVNPDFSQVEVDEQIINTTRFELFFPERRQFFLENADLFSSFGFERSNPFFSRRIGVTRDTTTGVALQNPIYYGARLSGKLTDDYRIGLLNMQTAANFDQGLPSYNYTVAAAQRKIADRSNLGAIFVNKQNLGSFTDSSEVNLNFNRVVGLDYNLATKNNKWNGKTYVHRSFSDREDGDDYVHGLSLEYRQRYWNLQYFHAYVGQNYNAEVGFVPRKGFFTSSFEGQRIDYPTNPKVVQKGPFTAGQVFSEPGAGITDYNLDLGYEWRYTNTAELRAGISFENIFLFEDFDPTRTDAIPLPGNRNYGYWRAGMEYVTDQREIFSSRWELEAGEFFNGYSYSISGGLLYRYQPKGSINMRFNFQYIDLPKPYASTALLLIGPRIDLTFSKSLFLTTFLQYNEQFANFNLNARLQWRFAPVSDFFLVYTDNYNTVGWEVRNRSVVAKATYWLNI